MCLGNSRKEPSHSRQIETRELIHRFLMGTAKNFEQLLGRTVMRVYVSWQTLQLVYKAHQVDFRKSMRFRVQGISFKTLLLDWHRTLWHIISVKLKVLLQKHSRNWSLIYPLFFFFFFWWRYWNIYIYFSPWFNSQYFIEINKNKNWEIICCGKGVKTVQVLFFDSLPVCVLVKLPSHRNGNTVDI